MSFKAPSQFFNLVLVQTHLGKSSLQSEVVCSSCTSIGGLDSDSLMALQTFVALTKREPLLPDVEQILSEPAGQNLSRFIQQFRELDISISVVLPQKHLRLYVHVCISLSFTLS